MQGPVTPQMSTSFSDRIRAATWDAHAGAEHAPFMQDLLAGRSSQFDYAQLVVQHHAIYSVLEAAVDANSDPTIAPMLLPELRRLPELVADLEVLAGPDWSTTLTVTPSTRAYCDRLESVCFDWPGGLVAHHYTRYLGDLSGGVVIGRVVARVLDLPDGQGTRFYRFDEIESPKAVKDAYRDELDRLPWDEPEQDRVIAEVLVAYASNTEILLDLTPEVREPVHALAERALPERVGERA